MSLFDGQMDNGNSIGEVTVADLGEPNLCQQVGQFIGQRKHANGFRQMGIGFAGTGDQLSQKGHDIKRIHIIQPPEGRKGRLGKFEAHHFAPGF